jgi:hypothetical protein
VLHSTPDLIDQLDQTFSLLAKGRVADSSEVQIYENDGADHAFYNQWVLQKARHIPLSPIAEARIDFALLKYTRQCSHFSS